MVGYWKYPVGKQAAWILLESFHVLNNFCTFTDNTSVPSMLYFYLSPFHLCFLQLTFILVVCFWVGAYHDIWSTKKTMEPCHQWNSKILNNIDGLHNIIFWPFDRCLSSSGASGTFWSSLLQYSHYGEQTFPYSIHQFLLTSTVCGFFQKLIKKCVEFWCLEPTCKIFLKNQSNLIHAVIVQCVVTAWYSKNLFDS